MTKESTIKMLMSLSPKARIAVLLAAKERMQVESQEQSETPSQESNEAEPASEPTS